MKYRKKPVVIEATRWFKNGDHPLDYSLTHDGFENGELRQFSPEERKANSWEGDIVRYFRHPEVSGESTCNHCGKIMHDHGWIDTLEGGHIVCPGDWIITGIEGEHYPCKPQIFEQTYEPVAQQTDAEIYEVLFETAMNTAEQAMGYVQNNPDKFDARPGDDKLAIVCREFLKVQDAKLVEALEAVVSYHTEVKPNDINLMIHYSEMLSKVRAALATYRKGDE